MAGRGLGEELSHQLLQALDVLGLLDAGVRALRGHGARSPQKRSPSLTSSDCWCTTLRVTVFQPCSMAACMDGVNEMPQAFMA